MTTPENGFFTKYGDTKAIEEKILKLINDPKLSKQISKNNFKKAKQYDWDAIYQEYMKEYRKLLKK